MKRPLFVFAGQSNMMGAAVFGATEQICFENSFEYWHKPRRFGCDRGVFKNSGFPTGEFSYSDMDLAYGENKTVQAKSALGDYANNTYFCPSMCNLKDEKEKTEYPFSRFSEANNAMAASLAPFVVQMLEQKGFCCAFTHIAKGGVSIRHYLDGAAAAYFAEKVSDFFTDAQTYFRDDDTSERVLMWLQGENEASKPYAYYLSCLHELWSRAKKLGFTRFFIVRVDYFGDLGITNVMRAQEDFCKNTAEASIITRVASFFHWDGPQKMPLTAEKLEFAACRDSFYGYANPHINEKGFRVIAKYATPNIIRILFEGQAPVLEEELVEALLDPVPKI